MINKNKYIHTIYIYTCILYVSCINCMYVDDFKVYRANTQSDRSLKVNPTAGQFEKSTNWMRLWSATSSGVHDLFSFENGHSASVQYVDPLPKTQRRSIIGAGVVGTGDPKGYVGSPGINSYVELTAQTVNGNALFTFFLSDNANSLTYAVFNGFRLPSTVYLIRQTTNSYDKYDMSTKTVIFDYKIVNPTQTVNQTKAYVPVHVGQSVDSQNVFFAPQALGESIFVDLATFIELKKVPMPTPYQSDDHDDLLLDNVDPTNLFADFNTRLVHLSTSNSALLGNYDYTSPSKVCKLMNIGTLRYILRLAAQASTYNSTMLVVTKTIPYKLLDITNTYDIVSTSTQVSMYYSVYTLSNMIGVWPTQSNASYLYLYSLTLTGCILRDASGTCTTCQDGYYLHTVAPSNKCLQKFEFPDMKGASDSDRTVKTCTVSNCANCKDDYTKCAQCKTSYYWTEATAPFSNCYLKANIPSSYGINGPNFKLEKCTLNKCSNCINNYTLCDNCEVGYWYKETGPKNACFDSNSIDPGFGKQYSSYHLLSCRALGCYDCKDDYTICKNCTENTFYIEPGNIKTNCYLEKDIPAGWSKESGAQLVPCTVSGCGNCTDNRNDCLTCDVNRWYKEATGSKLNCYANAEIPAGWGKEAGNNVLKVCETANCYTCTQNYKNCDTCMNGFYYIEPTGTKVKCLQEIDIPMGYGKQLGSFLLRQCNSPGCLDCKNDYTICNPCPGMWYYGDPAAPLGCYSDTFKAEGLGKKTGTLLVDPCTVKGCRDCWDSYDTCVACNNDRFHTEETGAKSKCYLSVDIPLGYGKQANGTWIKACNMTGCKKCVSDYTKCQECATGKYYLESSGDKSGCYDSADIPPGYGKKVGVFLVYACKVPGCTKCFDDYTKCVECPAGNYFIGVQTDPTGCYTDATIPYWLGKNGTELKLEKCTMEGCGNCKSDYTSCIGCPLNQYHTELTGLVSKCYNKTDIPNGYGINGASQALLPCSDTGCMKCLNNYSRCEHCKPTLYYYEKEYKFCYTADTIPNLYGINGTERLLTSCFDYDCANCSLNYKNCTKCLDTVYFSNFIDGSVICYPLDKKPKGYGNVTGGNGTGKEIRPCQLSNCSECSIDYTLCLGCDNGTYTIDASQTKDRCYKPSEIPSTHGIDPESQVLKNCMIPTCTNCSLDYRMCDVCKPEQYYFVESVGLKSCYNDGAIRNGLGKINSMSKELKLCQMSGCEVCVNNYSTCALCNSSHYVAKEGGLQECYSHNNPPEFYGINVDNRELKRCSVENCRLCPSDFSTCVLCKWGYKLDGTAKCVTIVWDPVEGSESYVGETKGLLNVYYVKDNSTLHILFDPRISKESIETIAAKIQLIGYVNVTTRKLVLLEPKRHSPPVKFLENGFIVHINLGNVEGPFQLLITDNSGTGYLKKNLVISNLEYSQKKTTEVDEFISQSAVYGIAIVLTYTRIFVNYLGRLFVQSLSTFLDRLCSNWTVIGFTTGKQGSNFDYHVWQTSRFQTYNPWRNSAEEKCLNHNYLLDRNVNCNIFASYGSDIAFIYLSLIFCALVQYLNNKYTKSPIMQKFGNKLGLLLWLRRSQSIFLQVLLMCLLHLRFTTGSIDVWFIIFCMPLLLFYLCTIVITISRTNANYKLLIELRNRRVQDPNLPPPRVVANAIKDFIYENRKIQNTYALFHPAVYKIRCCLLAFTTIYMADEWLSQIMVLVAAEVLYMYLTHKADPYTTGIEYTLEWLSSIQLITIAVLKFVSNLLDVNDANQTNIQNAMEIITVATYIICVLLTVYAVVATSKVLVIVNKKEEHIPNVFDKPVDAVDNVVYNIKMQTRSANEAVVKENFGRIGHINIHK